jgi:hypothetical protein
MRLSRSPERTVARIVRQHDVDRGGADEVGDDRVRYFDVRRDQVFQHLSRVAEVAVPRVLLELRSEVDGGAGSDQTKPGQLQPIRVCWIADEADVVPSSLEHGGDRQGRQEVPCRPEAGSDDPHLAPSYRSEGSCERSDFGMHSDSRGGDAPVGSGDASRAAQATTELQESLPSG